MEEKHASTSEESEQGEHLMGAPTNGAAPALMDVSEHQAWTCADLALVFIRPFDNFGVIFSLFHA